MTDVLSDLARAVLEVNAVDDNDDLARTVARALLPFARRVLLAIAEELAGSPAGPDAGPDDGSPRPPACAHSDDFRSVRWYGTTYALTGSQAQVVKLLWQAWENGTPDVSGAALLEAADASSERLRDLFPRHAGWGTMIVSGGTRGTYRLSKPRAAR